MNNIIHKLFSKEHLSLEESEILFSNIINGKIQDELLSAILIALKLKGENSQEISGAVKATIKNAKIFDSPNYDFADIVGTGGDGFKTINISSACSIILSAMGYAIAKHGNSSVSSQSGASDIFNELNININISPKNMRKSLDKNNFCFLWAKSYHDGFKNVANARQILKTKTIFNILGPLCNPAKPPLNLLGVYNKKLLKIYAKTVLNLGHKHSIIVYGNGLDEVATHGDTDIAECKGNDIIFYKLSPKDFGLKKRDIQSIQGSSAKENAKILKDIFSNKGKIEHLEIIAANCALTMKLFKKENIKENVSEVLDFLSTGKTIKHLEKLQNLKDDQ